MSPSIWNLGCPIGRPVVWLSIGRFTRPDWVLARFVATTDSHLRYSS